MSTPRCLLYLDADGLQAWDWKTGRLSLQARFGAGSEGTGAFDAWLGTRRQCEYMLLADLPGEHYQLEELPPLGRGDRRLLIARKRGQCSRGSPFVAELALGASRILFVVLTQPELIQPWVSALEHRQAALRAILTVPLLLGGLARRLAASPHLLLASLTPAGMRLTLLEDGRLRFSRLQAWNPEHGEDYAAACIAEAARLRHYLGSQRLLPHDAPLALHILSGTDGKAADGAANPAVGRVGLPALGIASKLRSRIQGDDALPLFLHLAASQTGPQFAPPSARRFMYLRRARRAILAGGLLALVAGLTDAGLLWQEGASLREDTDSLRNSARQLQERRAVLAASLPALPAPPPAVHLAVRRHDALAAQPFGPLAAWQHVGAALDGQPELVLDQLEWSLDQPDDAAESSAEWPLAHAQHVEIVLRTPSAEPGEAALALESIASSLRRTGGSRVAIDNTVPPRGDRAAGSEAKGGQAHIRLDLPLHAVSP